MAVSDRFPRDLREFRLNYGLNRSAVARMLGVGPSTLARWENASSLPQSASVWKMLSQINRISDSGELPKEVLKEAHHIISALAARLKLSDGISDQERLHKIERTLSVSVLKAAQTDFRLNEENRSVEPVPFTDDLALFQNQRLYDVKDLLESLSRQCIDLSNQLDAVNVNSSFLKSNLIAYQTEASALRPNPRWLYRKGELIDLALHNSDFHNAASAQLFGSFEMLLGDHNELMRRYFGDALLAVRQARDVRVKDDDLELALPLFDEASDALKRIESTATISEIKLSSRVRGILDEVREEISQLAEAWRRINDPNIRQTIAARRAMSSTHAALYIGRLIFRVMGVVIQNAANVSTVALLLEAAAPGSLARVYQDLIPIFSSLPALP